jgi:hypothetical protein
VLGFVDDHEWKKHYVLPGSSSKQPAVYLTDYSNMIKAYQAIEDPIDVASVTHLGRHVLSRRLNDKEVSESDAKKFMEWADIDTRSKCYLEPLVLTAMRVSAGFSKKAGRYHLKRDAVDPPQALIDAAYPLLPQLKQKVERLVDAGAHVAPTLEGFIAALGFLASTLLQDIAVMNDELKQQPILALSPFNTAAFTTFRSDLKAQILANGNDEIHMTVEDSS